MNMHFHKKIILTILITVFFLQTIVVSSESPDNEKVKVLVLDNYNIDSKLMEPGLGDKVHMLNSKGERIRNGFGLKIGPSWAGCRIISVSNDGSKFVVCEKEDQKLTMYDTATGEVLWSLKGIFKSAVITEKLIYAVNTDNVFAIDNTGTIVKKSNYGGLDIAADTKHACVWIVGLDIKKCGMDLLAMIDIPLTVKVAEAGAFSVDVCSDGSVWVAERDVYDRYDKKNKIVKISPDGVILKSIELDFVPMCVRVDDFEGGVWVTGAFKQRRDFFTFQEEWPQTLDELYDLVKTNTQTVTCKYDSQGNLLTRINQGGYSLDIDPVDDSLWLAAADRIAHYSRTGELINEYTEVSTAQKWLAVVP